MCSGRVTDSIYMTEIEPAAVLLTEKPLKDEAGVVQTGGKLPFRCDAIGEIDHGEPALCQVHAVILIAFLVSVGPSAAMDADNDRERSCGIPGTVGIQNLPVTVKAIPDIVPALDVIGCGQAGITFFIPGAEGSSDEVGRQ